jgi:hypothetical protein
MAGDDARHPQDPEERQIETAEQERRRLEDVPQDADRDALDYVREALRKHDADKDPPA